MGSAKLHLLANQVGEDANEPGQPSSDAGVSSSRSITAIYAEHRDMVFHLALRYGAGRRAWAEDVTQEVFVSIMRHTDELEHIRDLRGWIYRITTNRCLNALRRERARQLPFLGWLATARREEADPELLGIADQGLRRVLRKLDALPAKVRVAFCMHHLDGLPQTEIASLLGHSRGYVSKLISRAEREFDALQRYGETDE